MTAIGSSTSTSQIWQQFISKTDTNSDGAVGVSELAALIGGDDSTSEAQSLIDTFDSDTDGTLSEAEFEAAVGGSNLSGDYLGLQEMPSAPPPAPSGGGASGSTDEESSVEDVFSSLDTNEDGAISLEELQAALGIDDSDENTSEETSEADSAQTLMDLVQQALTDSESSAEADADDFASVSPPPPPPPPQSVSDETETDSTTENDSASSAVTSQVTEQSASSSEGIMARMIEQLYQQQAQSFTNPLGVSYSV